MLTQKVSTIDELLQFVSTLRQKHGVRLWFRGEENADLTLIPSIQRSRKDWTPNAILPMISISGRDRSWTILPTNTIMPLGLPDAALRSAHENVRLDPVSPDRRIFRHGDLPGDSGHRCLRLGTDTGSVEREGSFGNCIYPIDADTTQEMLLPAFKHNHHNPELKTKILACSSTENNLRMYSQYSNFTVHNSLERLEDICDENMLYKIIILRAETILYRKPAGIRHLRKLRISPTWIIYRMI